MTIKRIAWIAVVACVTVAAMYAASTINGYLDMQTRSGAPGSPGSGYLRFWNDNAAGPVHCKTSGGAACVFDSAAAATIHHTIAYGFGYTGGSALPGAGFSKVWVTFPCTISGSWRLETDGTATIDVLVSGSSITGGSPPSGTGATNGATSGWTTSVSGPVLVEFNMSSVSGGAKFASLSFACNE